MSDNTKKRLFDHKFDIVAFILIAGIFTYFMIFNEVVDCGDSFQYANQLPMREPVYSLLIQLFQTISGESYRIPLGIFQNILAIICIYWTYRRISRIYDFRSLFRIATLALLLAPHIITPLASKTNLVLTSTVMTEGITISLYYVWFTVLIGILWEHYSNKKDMILAVTVDTALGLILAMTRGQMVICLVVELLVICFKLIEQKNNTVKKRLISILICFLIFFVITGVKSILTKAYNYAETGYFVKTVSSGPMLLANIVYVSDENDAEYLADEDLRQAYIRIVREIDEEGISFSEASGNIIQKARFHESSHETINFDHIDPNIREVIEIRYGIDSSEFVNLMIIEDRICKESSMQLLKHVFPRYIKNYMIIACLGFVRSVAADRSFLSIYAVLIYIIAIVLTIILLKKDLRNRQAQTMLLTLILICGTVLGTSLVIECITRYMIYNLPIFYISGMGMIKALKES